MNTILHKLVEMRWNNMEKFHPQTNSKHLVIFPCKLSHYSRQRENLYKLVRKKKKRKKICQFLHNSI